MIGRLFQRSPLIFALFLVVFLPRFSYQADAFDSADSPGFFTSGLEYRTYASTDNWSSPSIPNDGDMALTHGTVDSIDFNWGGGQVLDSGRHDGVIVHFQGWLMPDVGQMYYMCFYTDDGALLILDGVTVINDWWDRGPSCGGTADVDFSDGQPKELSAYYYENGGGAVAQLLYYGDSGAWIVVPSQWYTNEPITPVSTTTTTTTTIPETTTTTAPETSTTTTSEVIFVPPIITAPTPTDPEPTSPPSSAPTEAPAPVTTLAPSATSIPTPVTTINTAPQETQAPTTVPISTSPPETTPPTDPKPAPELEPEPNEPEDVEEVVSPIDLLTASNSELLSILTSNSFSSLSNEAIASIIESVEFGELTEEQTSQLISALNQAPDAVKKTFEEKVNIYSGQFDSYVPSGSKITVGERRVIVAVAAVTSIMGTSPSTGSKRRVK